ncbi:STAS domain-containing protein [Nocardioides mangrovicus]|uniref:STAS domain-containing protein n=1 Tax=Nocardioides mangrovicus TaxID=2478913 RepID=A0A3L8P7D3_9ACTN|nr:STAS domain-containing protein [Nocardioides mangrovicus]RLV51044.1 STAS domain-containing protein [Nocardioides mangrovicus]
MIWATAGVTMGARGLNGGDRMGTEIYRDGAVLVVVGPLDARCVCEVRSAVYDLLAAYPEGIHVDLTDVPWVDSAALNMLAMAAHHAEVEQRHLRLRGCSKALRRTLYRTRLRALFELEGGTAAG